MTSLILAAGTTVAAARRALAAAFRAENLDTPDLDARILVGHALALDRTALAANETLALTPDELKRIAALAQRRLAHEPVSRICGHREFWSLSFRVTSDVLDPRPETETLVEAALATLGPARRNLPLRIADLGTGSGALLVALLHELPHAYGVATDRSAEALRVARENAQANDVDARATFVACDYGAALAGGFDIVVTNPPYIRTGDIANLSPEVRTYDPLLALVGGPDGLDAYRAIAADAPRLLSANGFIVVECGQEQAEAVAMLFVRAGFLIPHPPKADLAGILRALVAMPTTSHSPNPENSPWKVP
jgi:release factor glutamine methyltransferase